MGKTLGIIAGVLMLVGVLFWNFSKSWKDVRQDDGKDGLIVFAASSIGWILYEEEQAIEAATGLKLTIVEAASSTLARQIEQGAPADVFITADLVWLDYLKDQDQLAGPETAIAGNSLSLVFTFETFNTFCNVQFFATPSAPDVLAACPYSGKVATGDPEFVPLGKYAAEALGFYKIKLDLVAATDARAARALFVTGAAGGAILYTTETRNLDETITAFLFPPETHAPIVYWAAPVKQSSSDATENLLNFLQSEPFKTILNARGFEVD